LSFPRQISIFGGSNPSIFILTMKTKIECPNCKTIIDIKNLYDVILIKITKFLEEERRNKNEK